MGRVEEGRGATAYQALRECTRGLLSAGDTKGALTVAQAANKIFPAEPQSGFDLGAILMLAKADPVAARAVLENALKRTGRFTQPSPSDRALALSNLGRLALSRGEARVARGLFDEGLKLDPESSILLYNAAAADLKLRDAVSCLGHFRAAFARAPGDATRDDYLLGAWAYNQTDRFADAEALLRGAIAKLPNESGLHLNLGLSLAMGGRPVEALLEYLYEFENGSANDVYSKQAREQFEDALARPQATPRSADAIEALRAAISGERIKPKEVLSHLQWLEEAGYRHPALDLLRAEALHASGDIQAAETAFRRLLESDPAFLPSYYDLSLVLRATGRREEALRLVSEAAKRNPSHWQLLGEGPPISAR